MPPASSFDHFIGGLLRRVSLDLKLHHLLLNLPEQHLLFSSFGFLYTSTLLPPVVMSSAAEKAEHLRKAREKGIPEENRKNYSKTTDPLVKLVAGSMQPQQIVVAQQSAPVSRRPFSHGLLDCCAHGASHISTSQRPV